MARLKEVEAAMVEHTLANRDKVSEGLVLLPGVKELLEKLQVRALAGGAGWRCWLAARAGARGLPERCRGRSALIARPAVPRWQRAEVAGAGLLPAAGAPSPAPA
jgi:hypothetical protein